MPEDIRLTGYDNTDISVMSNPSLTSVDIPMEDICLAALNMLCALMRGETAEPVIFRTGLKIRASTMPAGLTGGIFSHESIHKLCVNRFTIAFSL